MDFFGTKTSGFALLKLHFNLCLNFLRITNIRSHLNVRPENVFPDACLILDIIVVHLIADDAASNLMLDIYSVHNETTGKRNHHVNHSQCSGLQDELKSR